MTPYDRARFLVTSSRRGVPPYLVDLLEHRRFGWCPCPDFGVRIETEWAEGRDPERKTCKHIDAARLFLAGRVRARIHWRHREPFTRDWADQVCDSLLVGMEWIERSSPHFCYGKGSLALVTKRQTVDHPQTPPSSPAHVGPAPAGDGHLPAQGQTVEISASEMRRLCYTRSRQEASHPQANPGPPPSARQGGGAVSGGGGLHRNLSAMP